MLLPENKAEDKKQICPKAMLCYCAVFFVEITLVRGALGISLEFDTIVFARLRQASQLIFVCERVGVEIENSIGVTLGLALSGRC